MSNGYLSKEAWDNILYKPAEPSSPTYEDFVQGCKKLLEPRPPQPTVIFPQMYPKALWEPLWGREKALEAAAVLGVEPPTEQETERGQKAMREWCQRICEEADLV